MALEQFRAPALPLAPNTYDANYVNRVNQQLRTYFSQLDSETANRAYTYRAENFIGGGHGLLLPHIAAADSTDQYASGDNTATQVQWNTLQAVRGFTLTAGYAAPDLSGVYKIDYCLQTANTDNAAHDVYVWLTVNGNAALDDSARKFTVPARKSVGVYGHTVAYGSVVFAALAGDAIRLYWATDKRYNPTGPVDGVFLEHQASQVSPFARPAIPSAMGSISFLSASG
jgi:hypothetical protein